MKAPSVRDFSVFSHLGQLGYCIEQTLPMKAPSVRDFSVFSHLGHLGPLH